MNIFCILKGWKGSLTPVSFDSLKYIQIYSFKLSKIQLHRYTQREFNRKSQQINQQKYPFGRYTKRITLQLFHLANLTVICFKLKPAEKHFHEIILTFIFIRLVLSTVVYFIRHLYLRCGTSS